MSCKQALLHAIAILYQGAAFEIEATSLCIMYASTACLDLLPLKALIYIILQCISLKLCSQYSIPRYNICSAFW